MSGIDAMIKVARSQIGYREGKENLTKYNKWLGKIGNRQGGFGYLWCHSFISWCLNESGNAKAGPRTAGCEVGVAWFKKRKRLHKTPMRGDLVYYGPRGGTHVELVVAVSKKNITTIGGNTSGTTLRGKYFNGNGVYKKKVPRSSRRIFGYGRPAYIAVPSKPKPVEETLKTLVDLGAKVPQTAKAGQRHSLEFEIEYQDPSNVHTDVKDGDRFPSIFPKNPDAPYGVTIEVVLSERPGPGVLLTFAAYEHSTNNLDHDIRGKEIVSSREVLHSNIRMINKNKYRADLVNKSGKDVTIERAYMLITY